MTDTMDLTNLPKLPGTGILAPDGQRHTWGPIQRIHVVGRYQIVEYLDDARNLYPIESRRTHGRTTFDVYIDQKDVQRSYLTLDEALLGAIAIANDGVNTRADMYFARMLGLDRTESDS